MKNSFEEIDKIVNKALHAQNHGHTYDWPRKVIKVLYNNGVKIRGDGCALFKIDYTAFITDKGHFIHLGYIKKDNTQTTDTFFFEKGLQVKSFYSDYEISKYFNKYKKERPNFFKQISSEHKMQIHAHYRSDGMHIMPKSYKQAKRI